MDSSLLIDEITLKNMKLADIKKMQIKPELIMITKAQVLEIILISQVCSFDIETIRNTLISSRSNIVSNVELADRIKHSLILNLKK